MIYTNLIECRKCGGLFDSSLMLKNTRCKGCASNTRSGGKGY